MAGRGRPPKKKKVEYINTTSYTIWIDKYNLKRDGIVGTPVYAGKSIYLDPEEDELNQMNSPSYFLQGQLRIADAGENKLLDIVVRNEMSQLEITKYIERAEDIEKFKEEIANLTSINTIELLATDVKKSNKTLDYYFALQELKEVVDTDKKQKAGFYND